MSRAVDIFGVDCATEGKRVGLAAGRLEAGRLYLREVALGVPSPSQVLAKWLETAPGPALIALDAPLGWPAPLGGALLAHQAGDALACPPHELFRRETDRVVRARIGKQTLDVGADRIARTACAALALLHELRERVGATIPLAWQPGALEGTAAIEVYPAGTLRANRLPFSGYKRPQDQGARRLILTGLVRHLVIECQTAPLLANADLLDAAICVLAGADFLEGAVIPPPDSGMARKEGWIWVRDPVATVLA